MEKKKNYAVWWSFVLNFLPKCTFTSVCGFFSQCDISVCIECACLDQSQKSHDAVVKDIYTLHSIQSKSDERGKNKRNTHFENKNCIRCSHVAKAMSTFLCLHGTWNIHWYCFAVAVAVALITFIITVIIAHRIIKLKEYRWLHPFNPFLYIYISVGCLCAAKCLHKNWSQTIQCEKVQYMYIEYKILQTKNKKKKHNEKLRRNKPSLKNVRTSKTMIVK